MAARSRILSSAGRIGQPRRTCGRPASMRSVVPLTKLAAGLSRYTMPAETSASVEKRPIGRVLAISRIIGAMASG
jgi:hypothetical protein